MKTRNVGSRSCFKFRPRISPSCWISWVILLLVCGAPISAQVPFEWNKEVPIKRPVENNNCKLVLFDVSHGGTQGAADWVMNGAFSDFADALVTDGFTVQEYRGVDRNGDGIHTFVDDRESANLDANEAVIEYEAIKYADVFVLAETNRPMRIDEYAALKKFVDDGKGIYFISDHYNADRNLNTWDSTEVFNGYNRSDLERFNMQPHYGDLRNPQDAARGWLAENFGLRFRFNAINWLSGASGIVPPDESEGLTEGVGPVLIAAGATLAIVDETKAKGIVYFSESDRPASWRNAVEGAGKGLYFGGQEEGPFVAISKPSKGKAAFIGDSSPIEDISPQYVREDSGGSKRLHNGWNDAGNAAQLSINIVRWLATPEDYVGFSSDTHPAGALTPKPLAEIEKSDPDNGEPWSDPRGSYDPWNPNTFAAGSYGAKFPRTSDGPTGDPIQVAAALETAENRNVKVIGRVARELNTQFGLELADIDDPARTLAVQLPARFRDEFSPLRNPDILNKLVIIVGRRSRYMSLPGLKNVKSIQIQLSVPSPSDLATGAAAEKFVGDVSLITATPSQVVYARRRVCCERSRSRATWCRASRVRLRCRRRSIRY